MGTVTDEQIRVVWVAALAVSGLLHLLTFWLIRVVWHHVVRVDTLASALAVLDTRRRTARVARDRRTRA